MLDNLEHNRRARNGKDGPHFPVISGGGLGNTNPVATRGTTFGVDVPLRFKTADSLLNEWGDTQHERPREQSFSLQGPTAGGVVAPSLGARFLVEAFALEKAKTLKPAGQVVLFRKVMEDWSFNEKEAATLLGFEIGSDIKEVYLGMKHVRHRDANDRLRAVLRIAADLDALYQEVAATRDWLSEPQSDLDGATPRALLNEGSMENLLRVKYYVSYISGR